MKEVTMYSISDLLEIGYAEELIMGVKVESFVDDVVFPSDLPSAEFDE